MLRRDFLDAREIGAGKIYVKRSDVFLQILATLCAGNRHDVVALCQYPGKRKLCRRTSLLAGNFASALPPRPSFRCFILSKIRSSSLARSRNRQAMALQNFSIRRSVDGEIQFSRSATFVAGNLSPDVPHKLYRPTPGDRYDEDAPGSGESVHCATGTRSRSPDFQSAGRDIRFLPHARAMRSRSFVVDGPDVGGFFLRLCRSVCEVSQRQARGKSSRLCARQTVSINPDGSHHFSRRQGIHLFLCRGDEQYRAALFRRFLTGSYNG
jgi:hypothetical protein